MHLPDPAFHIRPATAADDRAIRSLIREGRINPLGIKWKRFLVAVISDGTVIGCGQLKPHRDGSMELASLAVAKAWRKKGIARQLMHALIKTHDGVLHLMCADPLGPFYEAFGFVPLTTDEMPKYFRRVSKLVKGLELFGADNPHLLVMRRDMQAE